MIKIAGKVAINNGSGTATGTDSFYIGSIFAGDSISVDRTHWYRVTADAVSETGFSFEPTFGETSVSNVDLWVQPTGPARLTNVGWSAALATFNQRYSEILTTAGADRRLKLAKAATGDYAEVQFLSGANAKAYMGLLGSDVFRLQIESSGRNDVLVMNGLQVQFPNDVSVYSTTASSSATTGALVVAGGMGVGGRINAGGLQIGGTNNYHLEVHQSVDNTYVAQFVNSSATNPHGIGLTLSGTSNNGSAYFIVCADAGGNRFTVRSTGRVDASEFYDSGVLLTDYVFDKLFNRSVVYSAAVQQRYDALDARMFNPAAYSAYWREHGRLWGMPALDDCIDGRVKAHSLGTMVQKLWQTDELQAIHIDDLDTRIQTLTRELTSVTAELTVLRAVCAEHGIAA